jgi:hypothetical protein
MRAPDHETAARCPARAFSLLKAQVHHDQALERTLTRIAQLL